MDYQTSVFVGHDEIDYSAKIQFDVMFVDTYDKDIGGVDRPVVESCIMNTFEVTYSENPDVLVGIYTRGQTIEILGKEEVLRLEEWYGIPS